MYVAAKVWTREGQNILETGEAREMISEAVVVLESSVDTAVSKDEFPGLPVYPRFFCGWLSRRGAEPLRVEPVDEVREGGVQHCFRAG